MARQSGGSNRAINSQSGEKWNAARDVDRTQDRNAEADKIILSIQSAHSIHRCGMVRRGAFPTREVVGMATTRDIARALKIDEQTVRRYARDGIIPFSETLGGHRRYDLDEVRAALARARSRQFEPLNSTSERDPRLSADGGPAPLRLARSRRRGISRAMIAEANVESARIGRVPFIGLAGSSRFVVGQGASARR